MSLNRRKFLKYLAVGAIGAGAAGSAAYFALNRPDMGSATTTQSSATTTYIPPVGATEEYAQFLSWLASVSKPYANQALKISLEYEFTPLALQQIDLDFFNATGIDNQYSLRPYYLHLGEISQMVQTQSPTYDVFSVDYQDVASYKDYILSPTELADQYPELTYQKINPSDFLDIPWAYCANYPPSPYQATSNNTSAQIFFLPLDMATMVQFYRGDLYQNAGLSPATTWEEYLSNAQKFTHAAVLPYAGTVNEANPDISIVYEFANFLTSFGGAFWQVNGNEIVSEITSSNALNALETYVSLKPYSDPASYTYTWEDIEKELARGVGAAAIEFSGFDALIDDPVRSAVVGKVDYAPNPAGSVGSFSMYGGSGVAVSKFSKHPEEAWLWLQWATALGTQEQTLLGYYHAFPSRKAVFDNSLVQQAVGTSAYRAVKTTKQIWDAGKIATLLPFPKWGNLLQPIAFYLNQAWVGKMTPTEALSGAQQEIEKWGSLEF